jgi:hypothetical protein
MNNHVKYTSIYLIIDIEKPIFETDTYSRVRINKKYADQARISSKYLIVRCPKGELMLYPKTMKKLKTVEEVFLYPNNPMKMYELDIPHCEKKPDRFYIEKEEEIHLKQCFGFI